MNPGGFFSEHTRPEKEIRWQLEIVDELNLMLKILRLAGCLSGFVTGKLAH
jgi:hypothetical protein